MTARFWQCLLLVEGALAALATMTISWLTTVPSIIAWMAYLMLLHALLVTATYASATAIDRANGRRDALGAVLRGLRVIAQEFCALGWLQWRMAIEPYMRMHDPGGGRGRLTPVLLLHGVLCNRAVWSFIRRKLLAAGFGPVVAINLEPTLGSIDLQAVLAVRALEALQETCNFRPVVVLGHSMGGLVARAAMRSMTPEQISASIATLITIATPHRGSDMARLLPGIAPKQMVPGSTWLVELNQDRQSAMPVPVISIYSDDDNLVAPRDNARLPGTQALGLPGLGHFGMLMSDRVWRELRRALQPFAPRPL